MSILKQAESAFRQGDHASAAKLYQQGLCEEEPDLLSLLLAAKSFLGVDQAEQAMKLYDRAIALAPSHATAFSRKTCYLLAERFGTIAPPPAKQPQISMRSLGNKGRFGNQVFQYGFLKSYATKFGLDIGTMEWPGTYLFPIRDPRPNTPLKAVKQGQLDMLAALSDEKSILHGVDVSGYFQFDTGLWSEHRRLFQETFRPSGSINPLVRTAISGLRNSAETLVVLHLRRGDFVRENIPIAPADWYLDWLSQHWDSLDSPRLYIASDAPDLLHDFSGYQPVSLSNLGVQCKGFEFSIDWFVMQVADILVCSNSTFSISAAMTNQNAGPFLRPDRGMRSLVEFEPWNTKVLLD